MSILSVYSVSSPDLPNKVLTHLEDIASTLADHGILFDRWQATTKVVAGASQEEVINSYRQSVDELMTGRGLEAIEVISVNAGLGQQAELRASLLDERLHDTDEVRLFVAGRGLLSLHIGDFVYTVQCEKNDRISIPAGTRHWFDLGEQPHLVAIRLFATSQGAAAKITGDAIASQFPRLDD
ncbi:acireductone dioxygenase [Pseudomonas putida]|uniref:1,2-dihydroxy-3-keto-5-methylthiopentene dioxygenase n=1 Tax=Pseudomonas putida TaxID=303 RepID=UPI002363E335|nr:acireductone dioxygenase [Pseudomonas putida]MDD1965801.1 acireductone dioxygenase [Pseudomonas putida]